MNTTTRLAVVGAVLAIHLGGANLAYAQSRVPIFKTPTSRINDSTDGAKIADASDADGDEARAIADVPSLLDTPPKKWLEPRGMAGTIQLMLLLTAISLAPAILVMTTSFVRIIVVMGLLRQAIGAQQIPPSQVMTSLALFMTALVMAPVWTQAYREGIEPYVNEKITLDEAWNRGVGPIRKFMSRQIEAAGNSDDVWMLYEYASESEHQAEPETYDDVPLHVLAPAFMLSELKTSFLIGFQIYLPFLVIDLVVSSVTISMGMMMLPPTLVSLPMKLALFVLVDGWTLLVGMLLESFR